MRWKMAAYWTPPAALRSARPFPRPLRPRLLRPVPRVASPGSGPACAPRAAVPVPVRGRGSSLPSQQAGREERLPANDDQRAAHHASAAQRRAPPGNGGAPRRGAGACKRRRTPPCPIPAAALRGHSSQPPQPDRYPQYRAVRFSPPELSPSVSGRPRRKTDKTAPGRGATRHSVGRSPAYEYEAGR